MAQARHKTLGALQTRGSHRGEALGFGVPLGHPQFSAPPSSQNGYKMSRQQLGGGFAPAPAPDCTLRAGDPTAVFLQPYGTCWSHAPRPSQSTHPRAACPPWVSLGVGTGVTTTPPRFLAPGFCPHLFRGFPPCRQMPEIILWGYSFASWWPYNAGWGGEAAPRGLPLTSWEGKAAARV